MLFTFYFPSPLKELSNHPGCFHEFLSAYKKREGQNIK
ncbi:hypothetical protein V6Z11_D05G072100 [Gossypium hirsutum]